MLPSPFVRGKEAYSNELELKDNPFSPITAKFDYDEWKRGWKLAHHNDPLAPLDDDEDEVADVSLETGFESDDD